MITLGVRDLVVSVKCYEEGLDFPAWNPRRMWHSSHSTAAGWDCMVRDALAADATVAAQGNGFESFTLLHNVRSEAEVDAVMNQAIKAGAILVKKPQKASWGGYSGYFKDPDGHLWK